MKIKARCALVASKGSTAMARGTNEEKRTKNRWEVKNWEGLFSTHADRTARAAVLLDAVNFPSKPSQPARSGVRRPRHLK